MLNLENLKKKLFNLETASSLQSSKDQFPNKSRGSQVTGREALSDYKEGETRIDGFSQKLDIAVLTAAAAMDSTVLSALCQQTPNKKSGVGASGWLNLHHILAF